MRHTVRKWIWVWDFDKEEKWLNEMAAKGLCLVGVGFCKYEFEDCEPGEYQICMQLLDQVPSKPESQTYIAFLEETGAEHIGSYQRWVYLRRKAALGKFELFSDYPSRIKHLTKVLDFIGVLVGLNLLAGIGNVAIAMCNGTPFNYVGLLNLFVAVFGTIGTVRLWKKCKAIKEEAKLFE